MNPQVYLFIVDTDYRSVGQKHRQIRVFHSVDQAIQAKDRYLQELCLLYPRNEYAVIESLAREFIGRFRVPETTAHSCRWCHHVYPLHHDRHHDRSDYVMQIIIRIESGFLADEDVDLIKPTIPTGKRRGRRPRPEPEPSTNEGDNTDNETTELPQEPNLESPPESDTDDSDETEPET